MDESEQPFAVNEYEPQSFPGMESELPLDGNDVAEQPIFEDNEYDQQSFPLDGNQNFNGAGHESEHFDGHESKQGEEEVVQEQNFVEHESDQLDENDQLAENEAVENDSKQESPGNDHNETEEFAEDLHPEGEQAQTNASAADTEDKKWPGWPGENVFRMLVPAQKVGNIIGRKGEYIKKMVEETRARIKILDGPPGTVERAVMVSAKEEPDASLPPAIDGLLRVHKRIVEGLEGDSAQAAAAPGAKVSTKLLVPATQAGSLIGKQGATVKTIQEASSCIVRVLGSEDLPIFALQDDRVVEVVGEPAAVHKAIELIGTQLRKFLVDRTVIPLFEMQMQHPNTHMEHMPPPHQASWGPPHGMPPNTGGGPGPGYGPGHHYMPPPRQHDNFYPPPEMPPPQERQPHHGISAYGREPAMGGQAPANTQSAPTMITQVTQHMQIPLSYADAVIGASGSSISYIRRASGATVTIQESRGVPGEMTVEISGTASQVQAAQQLIQNCMAGAGAPAPAQTAPSTEQGYSQNYSSYAAAAPTYASPASNTGYASQQGAYGSVYGNSYGY